MAQLTTQQYAVIGLVVAAMMMLSSHMSLTGSWAIWNLLWNFATVYAVYLSFKCNKGFSIEGLLGALLFGPFYAAYKVAKGCPPGL
jgi:hypothetical protein